eukprot:SAG25_NODE_5940_length_603_cov_3.761905_1_plen_22_part_01
MWLLTPRHAHLRILCPPTAHFP